MALLKNGKLATHVCNKNSRNHVSCKTSCQMHPPNPRHFQDYNSDVYRSTICMGCERRKGWFSSDMSQTVNVHMEVSFSL